MVWTTSDKVVSLRSRHAAIDVGVETLDGWRRHISGRNASVLAFFGFLSIFPLLLVATTVLGFVLEDNPDLQQRIIDGALDDIPVLGQTLSENPASLNGNIWALLIGLALALWSATKAFVALQGAQDDVWEVHVDDRNALPKVRGKALLGLLIIGGAQIGSIVITTLVTAADLPNAGRILLTAATILINIAVIFAMFKYLVSASLTWRMVWPGAIIGGLAFTLLQQFGTMIVKRITDNASVTYGQFALVLGLVTWLSLLAIATLMSCEFNAALARRRSNAVGGA
jgi:YihY family inner membrane protein